MPHYELPPRFQSHVARARRVRMLGTSLLVICILAGTGSAFAQVAPSNAGALTTAKNAVASAREKVSDTLATAQVNISDTLAFLSNIPSHAHEQLAAAAASSWLERVLCALFRNCPTAPIATSPSKTNSYSDTKSADVKPAQQLPPPTPPIGGVAATPVATSKTSPSGPTTVVNNPVIERIRETVRTVVEGGIDEATLNMRLAALEQNFSSRIGSLAVHSSARSDTIFETLGMATRIENLFGTNLTDITVDGVSGLTDADIPDGISVSNYLPLTGGTLTGDLTMSGTLTAGTLSVSGLSTGSALAAPYFTATSSAVSLLPFASSTAFSSLDGIFVGRTATTTLRGDGVASSLPFASTTMITATTASSTNLWISGIASGSLLKTTTGGQVTAATAGSDYLASYDPFTHPAAGQSATTSLLLLNGAASSTLLSANWLKVGGTASTTIDTEGDVGIRRSPTSGVLEVGNSADGIALLNVGGTGAFYSSFGYNVTPQSGYVLTVGHAAGGATGLLKLDALSDASDIPLTIEGGASQTGDYLRVQSDGSAGDILSIKSTGNVGIGTTSPATLLSVAGNAYLTGGLGVGKVNTSANTIDVSQFGSYKQNANTILYASTTNNSLAVGASGAAGWMSASSTVDWRAVAVGPGALATTPTNASAINNTAVGYNALTANTTGLSNAASGYLALAANTTGNWNVGVGATALAANTTGAANTAVGYAALATNSTGGANSAFGWAALGSGVMTGTGNNAFGRSALQLNTTGNYNAGVGYNALTNNTTGSDNIAVGATALGNNTTGSDNVAIGFFALLTATTSSNQTAIGYFALRNMITNAANDTEGNVAVGYSAGSALTYGGSNIFLGFQAGDNVTTGSNNLVLGYNIDAPSATDSNQLNIGNTIFGLNVNSTGTTVDTDARIGIGTTSPVGRFNVAQAIDATTYYGDGNAQLIVSGNDTNQRLSIGYDTTDDFSFLQSAKLGTGFKNLILQPGGGNVGIGSTTPWGLLSVTNTGSGPSFVVEDDTSPDSTPFIINANGQVGIGTASPGGLSEALLVKRTSNSPAYIAGFVSTNTEGIYLYNTGDGSGTDAIGGANVNAILSTYTSGGAYRPLALVTNDIARLFITVAGDVGIGTTTPGSLLSVGNTNGINFSTATSSFSSTGGINLAAGCFAVNGTCVGGSSGASLSAANTWTALQQFNGQASTTMLSSYGPTYFGATATSTFDAGGKLGVLTNSPTYALDVTGLGHFTGLVDAANFVATSTSATTTLSGGFAVATNGLLYDQQTGRVGIGTASPAAKLQVVGNTGLPAALFSGYSSITGSSAVHDGEILIGSTALFRARLSYDGNSGGDLYIDNSYDNADGDIFVRTKTSGTAINALTIKAGGNVGIGTTTPWRTLSVTGTVGFDGLTGSTGAGSLCLDSNKQVVYNSASDNCLSSTRDTKHDISPLSLDDLAIVNELQPVSFIYNEGDGRTRYGFIAEDTANVDAHLATYNASGTVSGIDDRSILAVLVSAIKQIWTKVMALVQSDEAQNARIEQLEAEVAALKSQSAAAGAPQSGLSGGAGGSSAPQGVDTDTATTTTPSEPEPTATNDNPPTNDTPLVDAPPTPEPAPELEAANDNPPPDDTLLVDTPAAPEPAPEPIPPEPANDNTPPAEVPATGTE